MVENTKQKLIREIASAFLPLQTSLSDNSAFEESMLKLGWEIYIIPTPILNLGTELNQLLNLDFLRKNSVYRDCICVGLYRGLGNNYNFIQSHCITYTWCS